MYLLYAAIFPQEKTLDTISIISILLSAVISFIIFLLSERKFRKERLVNKFDNTYKKAFLIKNKIENKKMIPIINNNFHFELDYILNNENLKNEMLDYITEVENYFSVVVGKIKLDSSFKKLSSFALYARWCALYGFIIKMREINNNKKMFNNFTNVINKMEKMDKIKVKISTPANLYYIGIRNSDCNNQITKKLINETFFRGSINMFPGTGAQFPLRPNQNIDGKFFLPYIENQMIKLIQELKDEIPQFMFYNPSMAYRLPSDLRKYVICLNDKILLNTLNDKILCKTWLSNNGINIIGFKTMLGQELISSSYKDISYAKTCVIQSNYGGGGIGTYLLQEENFEQYKEYLNPLGQYMISSYIDNSISVNTHIFISDKQTILSPGSIQIIEIVDNQLCYRGADFIAFKNIKKSCKEKIRDESIKIANLLRNKGYRGVAGIDFIISQDDDIYCSEINTRFQASSILLDLYLSKINDKGLAHSVYELNMQAFNGAIKSDLCFDDDIGYSCYYYYDDGKPIDYYCQKAELLEKYAVRLDTDGFAYHNENTDKNSYLFRAIFNHQICAISPDNTLWINDNIVVEDEPKDLFSLKIALLNQGVRIENAKDDIKKGVYESVDIELKNMFTDNNYIDINCAIGINLSQYSPYVLDCKDFNLEYYGKKMGVFKIEKDLPDEISELSKKIIYKSTDRIRIKMVKGCEFKNYGIGCEFCDVPFSDMKFTLSDIKTALEELKNSCIEFRHILIGGGTCLSPNIWEEIVELAKFIKEDSYLNTKPISLMSVLPSSEIILRKLKDSGIEEVAFNLEIANENLAKELMPGKYKSKEFFYNIMKTALNIFGENNVRSAMIVGIDKKEDLINEIRYMTEYGIMPCLSALRALPNANAKFVINPSNKYLANIYNECKMAISNCNSNINKLGPPCKRCCNNMLID